MMNAIIENQFIRKLTDQFRRSPLQKNRTHESDAEIVRFSTDSNSLLAITTDSIVEEIALGLYNDPHLIGWMTVMVNMSDLAAVGAQPLGILVSEVLPAGFPEQSLALLQQGIQDACDSCGTFVLGGDTNFGQQLMLTGCALGAVNDRRFLSRMGCQPGDILYSTGPLGVGNAFALSKLAGSSMADIEYKPTARLKESRSLPGVASACMDTSDGVIATLDQLMRLNHVGFELDEGWESNLHPAAKELADAFRIPPWLLLAGQHGEFELLFTVAEEREVELLRSAEKNHWHPLPLGFVTEEPEIRLPLNGEIVRLDTSKIRNLASQVNGDIQNYINQLLVINNELQKGASEYVSQ
jgi:thiamine-monophosphate kinase